MSSYERCPNGVEEMARDILCQYASHKPLLDARVKIDFVFAFSDPDSGRPAIMLGGYPALGVARRIGLKDRALGRGDAEVMLDGDWWKEATGERKRALLDHELHHFEVKTDKHGRFDWDDLNRPRLLLRKHDFDFGWFTIIAERHGKHSTEHLQFKTICDAAGQFYWPELFKQES